MKTPLAICALIAAFGGSACTPGLQQAQFAASSQAQVNAISACKDQLGVGGQITSALAQQINTCADGAAWSDLAAGAVPQAGFASDPVIFEDAPFEGGVGADLAPQRQPLRRSGATTDYRAAVIAQAYSEIELVVDPRCVPGRGVIQATSLLCPGH